MSAHSNSNLLAAFYFALLHPYFCIVSEKKKHLLSSLSAKPREKTFFPLFFFAFCLSFCNSGTENQKLGIIWTEHSHNFSHLNIYTVFCLYFSFCMFAVHFPDDVAISLNWIFVFIFITKCVFVVSLTFYVIINPVHWTNGKIVETVDIR